MLELDINCDNMGLHVQLISFLSCAAYASSSFQVDRITKFSIVFYCFLLLYENIFLMGKRSSPPVRVFNRRC